MPRLASVLLLLAACGGSSPTPGGDDAGGSGDGPTTLATVSGSRLALTTDCIAVVASTTMTTATCVPLAGGAPHALATLPDPMISVLGAGDALVIGTTGPNPSTVQRIDSDGTVTQLAQLTAPSSTAVGLALSGANVVFTTGANATLASTPLAAGTGAITPLAFDSGNFDAVVVVGTTAYYANAPEIYSHDLTAATEADPGEEPIAGGGDFTLPALATDGVTVVAAGTTLEGTATTVVTVPAGATFAPLAAPGGPVAAIDGTAYVIAAGDIVAAELATGAETPLVSGEDALDVLATDDQLIWLTQDGRVRAQAR